MENDMFGAPTDIMAVRSSPVLDETAQTPNALIQGYSFDQTRIMNEMSMLAGTQGELISNVHFDVPLMNPTCIADPSSLVPSQGNSILVDVPLGTPCPRNNSVFQDQQAGATIASTSLSAIPAARFGLQEKVEALAPYMMSNWQDNSNASLLPAFGDRMHDLVPGTRFQTSSSTANHLNLAPNEWTSSNAANLTHHGDDFYPNLRNELSLSLATSPTTGQCSDVSSDNSLEQASCGSRGVTGSLGSNRHVNFSQAILGSIYLTGIQEILAQIARSSLGILEQINHSAACSRARAEANTSTSSALPSRQMTETTSHNADSMLEAQVDSSFARHDAAESKKSQLLTLLQLVDSRYNHCLDEIHTVVSAFHAATELDPQVHAHFALHTISMLYKDLRERISNYILSMGEKFNNSRSEEKERSNEALFIEKHWALQQLKRKEHQLWRPQRGLPERSVSVLRAWMFQNFLHPYPKDAEKQLLAVKSGLTRSQVSNWFINARVRLWKPLIEEMYADMNRRKALRN